MDVNYLIKELCWKFVPENLSNAKKKEVFKLLFRVSYSILLDLNEKMFVPSDEDFEVKKELLLLEYENSNLKIISEMFNELLRFKSIGSLQCESTNPFLEHYEVMEFLLHLRDESKTSKIEINSPSLLEYNPFELRKNEKILKVKEVKEEFINFTQISRDTEKVSKKGLLALEKIDLGKLIHDCLICVQGIESNTFSIRLFKCLNKIFCIRPYFLKRCYKYVPILNEIRFYGNIIMNLFYFIEEGNKVDCFIVRKFVSEIEKQVFEFINDINTMEISNVEHKNLFYLMLKLPNALKSKFEKYGLLLLHQICFLQKSGKFHQDHECQNMINQEITFISPNLLSFLFKLISTQSLFVPLNPSLKETNKKEQEILIVLKRIFQNLMNEYYKWISNWIFKGTLLENSKNSFFIQKDFQLFHDLFYRSEFGSSMRSCSSLNGFESSTIFWYNALQLKKIPSFLFNPPFMNYGNSGLAEKTSLAQKIFIIGQTLNIIKLYNPSHYVFNFNEKKFLQDGFDLELFYEYANMKAQTVKFLDQAFKISENHSNFLLNHKRDLENEMKLNQTQISKIMEMKKQHKILSERIQKERIESFAKKKKLLKERLEEIEARKEQKMQIQKEEQMALKKMKEKEKQEKEKYFLLAKQQILDEYKLKMQQTEKEIMLNNWKLKRFMLNSKRKAHIESENENWSNLLEASDGRSTENDQEMEIEEKSDEDEKMESEKPPKLIDKMDISYDDKTNEGDNTKNSESSVDEDNVPEIIEKLTSEPIKVDLSHEASSIRNETPMISPSRREEVTVIQEKREKSVTKDIPAKKKTQSEPEFNSYEKTSPKSVSLEHNLNDLPLSTALEYTLYRHINYQYNLICSITSSIFIRELKLCTHLENLFDFYFHRNGEHIDYFNQNFEENLNECMSVVAQFNLSDSKASSFNQKVLIDANSNLRSVVSKVQSDSDWDGFNIYFSFEKFVFHKRSYLQLQNTFINYCEIEYSKIKWPLNLIIDYPSIKKYQKVFNLLFTIKRYLKILNEYRDRENSKLKSVFIFNMYDFLNNFQYYCFYIVIDVKCVKFVDQLLNNSDYEQLTIEKMMQDHNFFLDDILSSSLLVDSKSRQRKILFGVFKIIESLKFSTSEKEIKELSATFQKLKENFSPM